MSQLLWTLALVGTGCSGMWLVPTRPRLGWSLYIANEVLWEAHGVIARDLALMLMAPVWGFVGIRNLVLEMRRKK